MKLRDIVVVMRWITLLLFASFAVAQTAADFAQHATNQFQVAANVTYLTAGGHDLKLDVYQKRGATTPQPTVVFFHGGFWVAGSKDTSQLALLPWMEMGYQVVNVEYRLGAVAQAPAAVEDCMCAMRFLATQAKTYNIDLNHIIVTGESAGGHLSLSMGMIPESTGLARQCESNVVLPKPVAIVNWYGITDVNDVIDGPNKQPAAMRWFGALPNRKEIADRVSPLNYVRAGQPPVLTVHGDSDTTVPYQEAVRLHEALSKAGVANQLLTIPGGKHGNFTADERTKIFATIREFLAKNVR